MIAKHVPMKSVRKSDFGGLVKYITNPQQKDERVGQVSVTNCHTDRSDVAVLEVLNTQPQNTRAATDKTYHLIVSFRAGEQPGDATLKAVEARLCEGLGYGEHQRVSAVHYDTDNLHLHIAINKIHPTRYTIQNPYNDHKILAHLCEKLEREYGLESDNHLAQKRGGQNRAQDMERHAGIESLLGWIKRECLGQIQGAQSWAEMHKVLRDNGLEIRERANGLVITDGAGTMVKASSLSRDLSKAKIEARLGTFEAAPELDATKPLRRYEARPVRTRADTSELYGKYRAEQELCSRERKAQSAAARSRKNNAIHSAKRTGRLKRAAIKLMAGGIGKKALYTLAAKSLKDEIQKIARQYNTERDVIQQRYRREAWADWLRRKATEGDSLALAALRTRPAAQELKGNTVTGQGRRTNRTVHATLNSITKKGTVIYRVGTLAIRDDGTKLAVSRGVTEQGLEAALRMAMQRYGNRLTVNGSDEFKEQIASVAATQQLPVTFAEATLERRRRSLARTRALGAAAGKSIDEWEKNKVVTFGTTKKTKRGRGQ